MGLAYVTAHDFFFFFRSLIDNPAPVERANSAILLVDQLEAFASLTEELEAVVRIFLDNGHYVVFASSVHPGRLPNLTAGLRALAETGQVIPMLPRPDTRMELLTRRARGDAEAEITRQREEIHELRTLLERIGKGRHPADSEATPDLRSQLEAERASNEDLNRKLGIAKAYCDSVQAELESVREALEKYQREFASSAESREALEAELATVRTQLHQSKAASTATAAENERAQLRLTELSSIIDELTRLRAQFEALCAEKKTWAEERSRLESEIARTAPFENELQSQRRELETAQNDAAGLRNEVQQLRTELSGLATVGSELSQLRSRLEGIEAERLAAVAAREEQRRHLDSKRSEIDALHAQVSSLSGQLEMSRDESRRARDEANELVRRAESLIAQIEANRITFAQAEAERQRQIEELEELAAQRGKQGVSPEDWESTRTRVTELEHALEEASRDRAAQKDALLQAQDNLEAALSRAEEETIAAQNLRAQSIAEQEQARAARERLESDHAELRVRYDQVESERDAFGTALQNAINERDSLEASSDQANAERAALRAAVDQIRTERDALNAAVAQLSEELQAVNHALGRKSEEQDALKVSHDEAVSRHEEQIRNSEALARDLESARSAFSQAESERQALAAALQEARHELERQSSAMDSLRHEAAAQVAGAHAQAGEVEGRLNRLRASFDNTGNTIKTASSDLTALRHQLLAATDALEQMASELASVSDQMVLEEAEFAPANRSGAPKTFADDESDGLAADFEAPGRGLAAKNYEPELLASLTEHAFISQRTSIPSQDDPALKPEEKRVPVFRPLPDLAALDEEPDVSI
ncbi:MAG: hypothetical protein HZB26_17980 [Candidatus Hydrogenedentes bacterium]|nr:hypothetical protein [Candidatus Hydrogenedentota bacterium]